MRSIPFTEVSSAVESLCRAASTSPAPGVENALRDALGNSPPGPSREALSICLENIELARRRSLPLCQDTGTVVIFVELGAGVTVSGGTIEDAAAAGTASACRAGFLRPSMVSEPFGARINTGNSTPPIVHLETVPGEKLSMSLVLRGAGTENAGRIAMLPPHAGADGIARFVVDSVRASGPLACPPLVVSVGVGGNMETCAVLAKKGLLRPFGIASPDPACAALEARLLDDVNALGIGPQGFGGPCSALDVRVAAAPCHMASLPVCVCMGCHALRTAEAVL